MVPKILAPRPPFTYDAKKHTRQGKKKKDLIYGNRFHSSDIGFENKRHNL